MAQAEGISSDSSARMPGFLADESDDPLSTSPPDKEANPNPKASYRGDPDFPATSSIVIPLRSGACQPDFTSPMQGACPEGPSRLERTPEQQEGSMESPIHGNETRERKQRFPSPMLDELQAEELLLNNQDSSEQSRGKNNDVAQTALLDTMGWREDDEEHESDTDDSEDQEVDSSSQDVDSDGDDDEDGGYEAVAPQPVRKGADKKARNDTPKISQRTLPKNPREFLAMLDQKGSKQKGRPKATMRKQSNVTSLLRILQDGILTEPGNMAHTVTTDMPDIKASTHEEQFALIKKSIPAGADNRRLKTQSQDLQEAVKLFGYKMVKAQDGKWLYKQMKTPLLNYQITATAWMIKRELGKTGPFGGLLADGMGMGKTIMSLACISGNPPSEKEMKRYGKTTLVVVPNLSVAINWRDEARKHCKDPIHTWVSIYSAKDKSPVGQLREMSLLITTYSELVRQYPSDRVLTKLGKEHGSSRSDYEKAFKKEAGFFFEHQWYRVFLDEAHAIKNFESRTSKACCALKSRNNWALSGTPLANSAEEFFPYLKFIRSNFTECRHSFQQNYITKGVANSYYETLASMVMYRRTTNDTFMGHKIISLPNSHCREVWVPLSREEKFMSTTIDQYYTRLAIKIKKAALALKAEDEEIEKKLRKIMFANLNKLRQASSHIFNLERWIRYDIEPDMRQKLTAAFHETNARTGIIDQILSSDQGRENLRGYEKGLERLRQSQVSFLGGRFKLAPLLELLEKEHQLMSETCSYCRMKSPPEKPIRLEPCGHFYCSSCYSEARDVVKMPGLVNDDTDFSLRCQHPECGNIVKEKSPVQTLSSIFLEASRDKEFREPGRDSNGVQLGREMDQNSFFFTSARLPQCQLPPSSRLTAAMAVICTWQEDAPSDKIIVFVQFIMTAKVLGRMLEALGVEFLYYVGSMNQGQKNTALAAFKEDPSKKILISTLRCGGQALNITAANRVIIVDPWWNTTLEKQAFCRVLRIGQTKEVHLVRIKAEKSIDARISVLQKHKDIDIDYALQDDGHIPSMLDDEALEVFLKPHKPEEASSDGKRKKSSGTKGRPRKKRS
ncbi:hypothetical protein HIM_02990 [Hirsutella minnesotensis 3608]|nr:hypothetical protein HIM_02990 [Hirsutella minnesotensis 3608]